ncbi:MAG: hypothetical protein RBG13Loki_2363 [Promethearchaeota archaeon CR_4]|nr:MAG: hypothetical protein RBG13Loki_2363 [Candidatus Lokiarchaeota archaeon CR_4]
MAITVIARITVKEGKMPEAIPVLKEIVQKIKQSEPGCVHYIPHTINGPKGKNKIIFYEKYADKEAFDNHNKNLKANMAPLNPFLEPGLEIDVCSEIL